MKNVRISDITLREVGRTRVLPFKERVEIARTLRANQEADPMGSWTGTPADPAETPQQDADDL